LLLAEIGIDIGRFPNASCVQAEIEVVAAKVVFLPPSTLIFLQLNYVGLKSLNSCAHEQLFGLKHLTLAITDVMEYIPEDNSIDSFSHCGLFI
jgi:hypothetical protein